MSRCNLLTSNIALENVKNEKVLLFSVKEAKQKGILSNKKWISNIDKNKEDTIIELKKEDLGKIEVHSAKIFYNDYTNCINKECCFVLK